MVTEYKTPDKKDTDLMFAVYQDKKTPNPFRRFVKATISNLGYSDFSEWLLD
jgi:hypothetical protein